MISKDEKIIERLRKSLESLTGHNTPTAYNGDDDDVGECPYCGGWNMHHSNNCDILNAEKLLAELTYETK